MGRHEIIGADGRRVADDDDDRVLRDGETLRVSLLMRDSMSPVQRAVAADAATFDADKAMREMRDFAALCQRSHEIKEQAYRDSVIELSNAWRTPAADGRRRRTVARDPFGRELQTIEEEDSAPPPPSPPRTMTADEARAIKDAAWNQMVAEMSEAWKGNQT